MLNIWRLSYHVANKVKNLPLLQSSLESTVVSLKQKWNTEQEQTCSLQSSTYCVYKKKQWSFCKPWMCFIFLLYTHQCQMAFDTLQSKHQTQDPSADGTPKILILTLEKQFCIICLFGITLFTPFLQIAKVLNTTHTTTGLQGNQFLWCSAGKNL